MKNFLLTICFISLLGSAYANGNPIKQIDIAKSQIYWKATKITGSHEGTLKLSSGELTFTDDNMLEGGSFTVDMTSLDVTDLEGEWKQKLIGHLSSDDFFSIETHKTASLKITQVSSEGGNKYAIKAALTIKGITKDIEFEAEVNSNSASATIIVDRTEFDIRYGSGKFFDNLGDKTIHDEFTLEVNLAF